MFAISEMLRNTHPAFADRGLPGTSEAIKQVADMKERGEGRLRRLSKSLDRQLASNRFVTGAHFTVADVTAFCALDFLINAAQIPIPPELANLRRWYDEVRERPSARASA